MEREHYFWVNICLGFFGKVRVASGFILISIFFIGVSFLFEFHLVWKVRCREGQFVLNLKGLASKEVNKV